ncbi:MAG: DMT family transporter [bacterium]|nr:DMT family transporter [bacterium]
MKLVTKGYIFIFLSTVLWGLFPVVVHQGVQDIPPISFAGLSILLSSIITFLYAAARKRLPELRKKEAYFPLLMITLFIVIIPSILFFIGASMTSGVNTAMLLQAEIIFTLIITPWFGEPTTWKKVVGAVGIFIGALFILYDGTLSINMGDLLIIASTLTYPFGNFYSKKALTILSPSIVLLVRSALGSIFLIVLAVIVEPSAEFSSIIKEYWLYLLLAGFFVYFIGKITWHEGLKLMDITKAISLSMTFPFFSILFLIFFVGEDISIFQWTGIYFMIIGVFFMVRRQSIAIEKTRYGKHLNSN